MREIKFRAWDKVKKEWCADIHISSDGSLVKVFKENPRTTSFEDIEIVQYTGLKDKNGEKEIYEGDIIEWKAYMAYHKDSVKFDNGRFFCYLMGLKEELQDIYDLGLIETLGCEIIGNIYENPELLTNN